MGGQNGSHETLALNKRLEYLTLQELEYHKPDIKKARELGMPEKIIRLLEDKKIATPENIQNWVGSHLKYDHNDAYTDLQTIVETGQADCYRGMLLIYTLLYFRRYHPVVVMLQAGNNSKGQDHNIVVFREKDIHGHYKYGGAAMSAWTTLMYRPPTYNSVEEVVDSYWKAYTSEVAGNTNRHDLKGFSNQFDIANLPQFGGEANLFKILFTHHRDPKKNRYATKKIYIHYTDNLMCTDIASHQHYPYPTAGDITDRGEKVAKEERNWRRRLRVSTR